MPSISELLAAQLPAFRRDLEALVSIDCPTHSKSGVDRAGAYVTARARELAADVRVIPLAEAGDCLDLRWRGTGRGVIMLLAHLDTVYPEGTVAEHPIREDGGRFYAPGAGDMKAGLLAGLYAASALYEVAPESFGELRLFCNSDEETGSQRSREAYLGVARDADAGLVLEAARENGAIVSARKGVGNYIVDMHGKAAHAGVEPGKGANAIVALAQFILELNALNGMCEGLTVNPGVVMGGTKTNVIPAFASVEVDLRVLRAADADAFETRLAEHVTREYVPGVRGEYRGGLSNPPMERTAGNALLADWAREAGREQGLEIRDVSTGGGSDGNLLAALGLPVLDGLGPLAGRAHNAAEEYVILDSILERTVLLARLIQIIAERRERLAAHSRVNTPTATTGKS